jgi:rod shape-determining protein MreD
MELIEKSGSGKKELPIRRYIIYAVLGIILIAMQMVLVNLIAIGEAVPDLLLILIVWIGIYEGYMEGILYGFVLGLLLYVASFDIVGSNALVKCVAGLFAAFFHKTDTEKQLTGNMRLLPIIFVIALLHNLVYGVFHINMRQWSFIRYFFEYSIASSLYTTAFGVFAYAVGSRNLRRPGQQ